MLTVVKLVGVRYEPVARNKDTLSLTHIHTRPGATAASDQSMRSVGGGARAGGLLVQLGVIAAVVSAAELRPLEAPVRPEGAEPHALCRVAGARRA